MSTRGILSNNFGSTSQKIEEILMSRNASTRVIAYVDGFNLYYGLREANLRDCYWLNVHAVIQKLLLPAQELLTTKYFTSRISGAQAGSPKWLVTKLDDKRKRQNDFLEALGSVAGIQIQYGKYLAKPASCKNCRAVWTTHEEKMTDVNIATAILTDAFQNNFDTAILISADSDLVPPVRSVRSLFKEKRVVVAFPPNRMPVDLKNVATHSLSIYKQTLKKCQLPDSVTLANGHTVIRPSTWS